MSDYVNIEAGLISEDADFEKEIQHTRSVDDELA